jgi:hypothetical protein
MSYLPSAHPEVDLEWAAVGCWFVVGVVEFGSKRRASRLIRSAFWLPGKLLRLALILATLGVLAACSDADPLPVATGPLYQLNPANWHATQQDLSGPPQVANN